MTILFPTTEQILSILLAESPNGVYPTDRADNSDSSKNSISSAEWRAAATILGNAYQSLLSIYQDKFLPTVGADTLVQWEANLFPTPQDAAQDYQTRVNHLLAKLQARGGISFQVLNTAISAILTPVGLPFQLAPYSGAQGNGSGGWMLGVSSLDVGTYLSYLSLVKGTPIDNSLDYAAIGLQSSDLLDLQRTAYLYEVRIFGNPSEATVSTLDQFLTGAEPARSSHVDPVTGRNLILTNYPLPVSDTLDTSHPKYEPSPFLERIDFGTF